MARLRFSIGIDLGTTNCAMAFEAFDTAVPQSEVFLSPRKTSDIERKLKLIRSIWNEEDAR